jgi:hypothetical protein
VRRARPSADIRGFKRPLIGTDHHRAVVDVLRSWRGTPASERHRNSARTHLWSRNQALQRLHARLGGCRPTQGACSARGADDGRAPAAERLLRSMATRLNLHVLPRRAADYTTAPAKCFGPMLT